LTRILVVMLCEEAQKSIVVWKAGSILSIPHLAKRSAVQLVNGFSCVQ